MDRTGLKDFLSLQALSLLFDMKNAFEHELFFFFFPFMLFFCLFPLCFSPSSFQAIQSSMCETFDADDLEKKKALRGAP